MKAVFYTRLFSDADMSIGAKMVYSQLIFRAVICDNESFDTDGIFDIDRARVFEDGWCGLDNVQLCQVAFDLNIDPKTVSRTTRKLKELGRINEDNCIFIPANIFAQYIELITESDLSGWELLLYSFIWNKTRKYKYVDTYRAKLSDNFGISETHLSNLLASLRSKGYIERKNNGHRWRIFCKNIMDNL